MGKENTDMKKQDITQHEIDALASIHNLADAHTHQNQSVSQRDIVGMLPDLWYQAQNMSQRDSEIKFIKEFFHLQQQTSVLGRLEDVKLVYAASIAMHITATYLAKKGLSVSLVEPCFDNLHDLIKHMGVNVRPIPESSFYDTNTIYENLTKYCQQSDAVFLVDPNNPTGFSIFKDGCDSFREVVRYCVDNKKILILDYCFASFLISDGLARPDVYEILEESGVSYIAMEDTGKTWPLQDAKCATLMYSKDLSKDLYPIYTSVLLNVSPFILNVVSEYVKDSGKDNFYSVRSVLETNRKCLEETVCNLDLEVQSPAIKTSVAWLKIGESLPSASLLQQHLEKDQVYVLPGTYFYWESPSKGNNYIRIALARDPHDFSCAMKAMKTSIASLG